MSDYRERGLCLLRDALGASAQFREGQWEAIEALLDPGSRLLVVQRTGWGKSVVYFIAAGLVRGRGPALIVSPLLSLMRNQIDLAAKFGLRAESINSTNREDWPRLVDGVKANEVDLLLVSPERLGNVEFRRDLLPLLERSLGLLVIDEAHCISDWGHDFRPDYRRILRTVHSLNENCSILGTTATANDRVVKDIQEQLGKDLQVVRGPLMRESLKLSVFQMMDQAERLAWLAKYVPKLPHSGIVYTLTVNDANRVAEWLRENGIEAAAYHSEKTHEERVALESDFVGNRLKALVATTALGMGYDKDDVGFVIHFQRPGSVIAYYQQVGRAGRNIPTAFGILLEGGEDEDITSWFIEQAFPGAHVFEAVKAHLLNGPSNARRISTAANLRFKWVEQALELMDVEGAVKPAEGGWALVDPQWTYDAARSHAISLQRYEEMAQMKSYGELKACRMEFLAGALDDTDPRPCGRCDNCKPHASTSVPRDLFLKAQKFLKSDNHQILPRKMLPSSAPGRKKLSEHELLLPGIALCVYNDAGWGVLVREGKYETHRYSDELVAASAEAIQKLDNKPAWLCWVPTKHQQGAATVPDFGARLAEALGIPAMDAVRKVAQNRPQKDMVTSSNQFTNVWDAFEVERGLPSGLCLLVDDIVDSGWTMTSIGIKLRRAGAAGVVPFALATARPRTANQ